MTETENKDEKIGNVHLLYTDDDQTKIDRKDGSKFIYLSIQNDTLSPLVAMSSDNLTADEVEVAENLFRRFFKDARDALHSMEGGVPLYTEHLNLRLTDDDMDELDELVNFANVSRSELIRSWISEKYEDFNEDYEIED